MAGQERIWHVMIGGKEQGPLTKAEVLEYLTHGMLAGSDLIWRPGFPDWKAVSEIGEFWQPPKRTTVQPILVQSVPEHVREADKIDAPSTRENLSVWTAATVGLLVSAFLLIIEISTGGGFKVANYAHTATVACTTVPRR